MEQINNFRKVRRDGRVIDEQMTLDCMLNLGWEPDIIVSLEWTVGGRTVEFMYPEGVLAYLLPSRDAIVLMESAGLRILNADGSERKRIPNEQPIDGKLTFGAFKWFETECSISPNHVCAVYEAPENSLYRFEIDAINGRILGVRPTQ